MKFAEEIKELRQRCLLSQVDFAKEIGFKHIKTIESPIKGGDGNTEYLAYFRKEMKNE